MSGLTKVVGKAITGSHIDAMVEAFILPSHAVDAMLTSTSVPVVVPDSMYNELSYLYCICINAKHEEPASYPMALERLASRLNVILGN